MTVTAPAAIGTISAMLCSLQMELPEHLLRELARLPVFERSAGETVFDASAHCAGFPLLLAGSVRVFRPLANGRSIELYRVGPSEPCILSLGCLLGGGVYPATGVAAEATRMLVMPPTMFDEWTATVPPFRTAVFRLLGERLVSVMQLVEEVTSLRLDIRLAAALLAHAGVAGGPIAITHQQLADELGTVREMISRVLDELARQGTVALARGRIDVLAPEQLRKLAAAR